MTLLMPRMTAIGWAICWSDQWQRQSRRPRQRAASSVHATLQMSLQLQFFRTSGLRDAERVYEAGHGRRIADGSLAPAMLAQVTDFAFVEVLQKIFHIFLYTFCGPGRKQ